MRNIMLGLSVIFVLVLAQGCATASDNRVLLHTRGMEQKVERNNIALDMSCGRARIRAIASAKYEAMQNSGFVENWRNYYRIPACEERE